MRICAGTTRGVFTVADGGVDQVLESRGVREMANVGSRLFAGTGDGLFASDDRGSTWAPSGLEGQEVWQIRDNGHGLLYAGTAPTGLYRSDDQGATWTELESLARLAADGGWCVPLDPPVDGRARALVVDGDRLRVGVEVGGIATSDDAGETWSVVLPGDNPDLHMMFAHPASPDTLYASTGYGRLDGVAEMVEGNAGVFRSEDAGESWTYAWRGITPRYSRPMWHRPPRTLRPHRGERADGLLALRPRERRRGDALPLRERRRVVALAVRRRSLAERGQFPRVDRGPRERGRRTRGHGYGGSLARQQRCSLVAVRRGHACGVRGRHGLSRARAYASARSRNLATIPSWVLPSRR